MRADRSHSRSTGHLLISVSHGSSPDFVIRMFSYDLPARLCEVSIPNAGASGTHEVIADSNLEFEY